jgi:hypothetical protein
LISSSVRSSHIKKKPSARNNPLCGQSCVLRLTHYDIYKLTGNCNNFAYGFAFYCSIHIW